MKAPISLTVGAGDCSSNLTHIWKFEDLRLDLSADTGFGFIQSSNPNIQLIAVQDMIRSTNRKTTRLWLKIKWLRMMAFAVQGKQGCVFTECRKPKHEDERIASGVLTLLYLRI
jgi:hypothetical protein